MQNHYALEKKLSKLLEWIDLPLEERPQLILGVFLHLSLSLLPDEYICKLLLL
jgi:hypothetical protein